MEIAERVREVMKMLYGNSYAEMERMSAIPKGSWRKMLTGMQRPTAEMLEAVCSAHPELTLWIATGIDDEETGQIAPGATSELAEWTATVLRERMKAQSLRGKFRRVSWFESFLMEMAKLEQRGIGQLHKADKERLAQLDNDNEEMARLRKEVKKKLESAMNERMKQIEKKWQSQRPIKDGE